MDTTRKHTHLSLCAGYGGIDLGLKGAGFDIDGTVFVEVEAFAGYNLAKKIEAGALGAGVIWPDLKTFPFRRFRGCFDILSGGFPCQPFSQAGKGNADEDPRHLFPYILRGIYECQPDIVVLENVDGISSKKLKGDHWRDPAGTPVLLHVLRELERVGYRATAVASSASEVGAPHQRNRWFIIGVANDSRNGHDGGSVQDRIREWLFSQLPQPHEGGRTEIRGETSGCCNDEDVADDSRLRRKNRVSESLKREEGIPTQLRNSGQRWPARPGQEQYGWEPPRVVGKYQEGHNLNAKEFSSYRVVGNGDSIDGRTSTEGRINDPQAGPAGEGEESARQFESSMGGNANGSSGGMGYAELCESYCDTCDEFKCIGCPVFERLCVSCDNRTDELRLLGNGVVHRSCSDAIIRGLKELMK